MFSSRVTFSENVASQFSAENPLGMSFILKYSTYITLIYLKMSSFFSVRFLSIQNVTANLNLQHRINTGGENATLC